MGEKLRYRYSTTWKKTGLIAKNVTSPKLLFLLVSEEGLPTQSLCGAGSPTHGLVINKKGRRI